MLVCPECNIEYEEGKKFCRKCGSFLLSEEGSTFELPIGESFEEGKTRENMFCTNCGTANKDDAKFCIHCGESLTETVIKKKPLRERLFKKVGFFQALLDFSFNQFVISKVIKFLYGLSILYAGLIAFIFVILGLNVLKGLGIFVIIIGAPLIFLLTVIYSRMLLETIIVISRIADYMAEIVRKSESKDSIHWNI